MYELVEGFVGVEVIVDDFLVCGFGDFNEVVIVNYDQNFKVFFSCVRERNFIFNSEKLKF